jgi:aryl-alcohol dehydrogenase-like predicted oxidoreductase
MQFIDLPRTDLRVSNLCFGTADFGASIEENESFDLLDQFFAAGGNFLDTAAIYADWTPAGKGSSEKLLGKWLKNRSVEAIVATKGGHPEIASMGVSRMTKEEVESDLDHSLKNLGTETIDLYYLHRDDPTVPVAAILSFLEGFVAAGKIRYYALSNWKLTRAQEALQTANSMGITGFVANQPLWSLAEPDLTGGDQTLAPLTAEFRQWHTQTGFPTIPYSSQAGGYFNKIAAGKEISGALGSMHDSELTRPINRGRSQRIEALAKETGYNITQLVLAYLLNQPFPVIPIIGCKNPGQLADSLSGADVKLTSEQVDALAA